jgi:hypothetical protein
MFNRRTEDLELTVYPGAPVAEKVCFMLVKVIERGRPLILSRDLAQANYCNITDITLIVIERLRESGNSPTAASVSQRLSGAASNSEILCS